MKKFLLGALLVVTTMFMASCKSGGSSSSYAQGDPKPTIDSEAGTVNGKSYDNKTECCWEVSASGLAEYGMSVNGTGYVWTTEFEIVAGAELAMWEAAQAGNTKASYSYKKNGAKDEDSCWAQNEDYED